jgi:hypothetical protein
MPRGALRPWPPMKSGDRLGWLWHHRLVRTLALMLSAWLLVETATISIFVLFVLETLHESKTVYGALFSAGPPAARSAG